MHELSIAYDILEIIKPNISDPLSLKRVGVSASALSGISFSSLTFCFNELCRIKGYSNALLDFSIVQVHKVCLQCGTKYECINVETICPQCNSSYCKISHGSTFNVDYIELF
jgi:Zn finger protein HypA/HybF involved in hydrogenase expression